MVYDWLLSFVRLIYFSILTPLFLLQNKVGGLWTVCGRLTGVL